MITYIKPLRIVEGRELEIVQIINHQELWESIKTMKFKGFKPFQIINNILCRLLENNQFLKISELVEAIEHA